MFDYLSSSVSSLNSWTSVSLWMVFVGDIIILVFSADTCSFKSCGYSATIGLLVGCHGFTPKFSYFLKAGESCAKLAYWVTVAFTLQVVP